MPALVVLFGFVGVTTSTHVFVRLLCVVSILAARLSAFTAGFVARSLVLVPLLGPASGFVPWEIGFVLEATTTPFRWTLLRRRCTGLALGISLTAVSGSRLVLVLVGATVALFLLTAVALTPLVSTTRRLAGSVLMSVLLFVPALLWPLLLASTLTPLAVLCLLLLLVFLAIGALSFLSATLIASLSFTRLLFGALLSALLPAALLSALLPAALLSALSAALLSALSAVLLSALSAILLSTRFRPTLALLVLIAFTTRSATVLEVRFLDRVGLEAASIAARLSCVLRPALSAHLFPMLVSLLVRLSLTLLHIAVLLALPTIVPLGPLIAAIGLLSALPTAFTELLLATILLLALLPASLPAVLLTAPWLVATLRIALTSRLRSALSGPRLALLVSLTTCLTTVLEVRFLGRVGLEALGPPGTVLPLAFGATAAAFAGPRRSPLLTIVELVVSLPTRVLPLLALLRSLIPALLLHIRTLPLVGFIVCPVRPGWLTDIVPSPLIADGPALVALTAAKQSVEPAAIASLVCLRRDTVDLLCLADRRFGRS